MNAILKRALLNAGGTAAYIILVASFMAFLQGSFADQEDTVLTSISALLLFVCSAAITAFLVLGKPVMLYLDGKKKDAVTLLAYTIAALALLTVIAFVLLLAFA